MILILLKTSALSCICRFDLLHKLSSPSLTAVPLNPCAGESFITSLLRSAILHTHYNKIHLIHGKKTGKYDTNPVVPQNHYSFVFQGLSCLR